MNIKKYIPLKLKKFLRAGVDFMKDDLRPAIKVLRQEFSIWLKRPNWIKLDWEPIADGPVQRVEAAGIQSGHWLYLIGGYRTLDEVVSTIDVLDLAAGKWGERIPIPESIAQTHCGIVSESGRYIYFIAGQVGIQCSPAVRDCHVFDLQTRTWGTLPPLPQKRYAPVTQLCGGRIHVTAGSKEDRVTPACEHWSLAVKDGQALESAWQAETPIPLGGPHRSNTAIGDHIYVLGSQWYDRPPIPGDPLYKCDWTAPLEIFFRNCYSYSLSTKQWSRLKDIPFASTHTEYSTFVLDGKIVVVGGYIRNQMLTDLIQMYDPAADRWQIIGRLPETNKGLVVDYYDGWLYVLTGQRGRHRLNAIFGKVLKGGFRAKFKLPG